MEARIGVSLPSKVRSVLAESTGAAIEGFGELDLTGLSFEKAFEFREVLPRGYSIATDGQGNFWAIDVDRSGDWNSILFVSHDPPVVVRAFPDLHALMQCVSAASSEIAHDVSQWVMEAEKATGMTPASARESTDAEVREFALRVDMPDFRLFDLRPGSKGRGFSWDLGAGPESRIVRDGERLLFAVECTREEMMQGLELSFWQFLRRVFFGTAK